MRSLGPWLRGNRLLLLVTIFSALVIVLGELQAEALVLGDLDDATETAEEDSFLVGWEGRVAAQYYASRGMYGRGFNQLADQARANPDQPRLLQGAASIAATEESLLPPNIGLHHGGLARLDDLAPLLGGPTPYHAMALWSRRDYSRAISRFAAVLASDSTLWLSSPVNRARVCFLYADALKVLEQHHAAARHLGQLSGEDVDPPALLRTAPQAQEAICAIPDGNAGRWGILARGELDKPRALSVDIFINRELTRLTFSVRLDRERARALTLDPTVTGEPRYRLPGAVLGGTRINASFLVDLEPEDVTLKTDAAGDVIITARYRVAHDDVSTWNSSETGRELFEMSLPEGIPFELVLPMWARQVPVALSMTGDGVEIRRSAPMPTSLNNNKASWSWGPDSPPVDRPLRLVALADLGTLNTAGILLPVVVPAVPKATLGLLLLLVVGVATWIHVKRRHEAPWSAWKTGSTVLDILVAGLLAPLLAIVVIKPLWFSIRGGQPLLAVGSTLHLAEGQRAYWTLGAAVVFVMAVSNGGTDAQARYLRRLGALLFSGYLSVQFGFVPWWQMVLIGGVIAPLVYFTWLVPREAPLLGMTHPQAQSIEDRREELLVAAYTMSEIDDVERALERWPAKVAEGKGSVEDLGKARLTLDALRHDCTGKLDVMLDNLGVTGLKLRELVLGVGPSADPWRNAAIALGFGGIPTLFLTLGTGKFGAATMLTNLAFFGLTFRWLRGANGLEKAVAYGLAQSSLVLLPAFLRSRTQVSLTAALVEAILLVLVLMTAGLLMDVLTTRRRWRTLVRLYDVPTVTRLAGGTAAAITAAVAGILANGSSEVVSLLWDQINGRFGGL
ncbi:MAG: hypothetical protein H6739_03695 [Alphaproteobacteria bacterium]|nr:hypothetical protein [Alphaproteobacteria bacterium]